MFENINIIYLGIIQGITEFLPISSSGHLVLFSKLTNFSDQGLQIDVAAHIGTLLAVCLYFLKDIKKLLSGVLFAAGSSYSDVSNKRGLFFNCFITATIPVVLVGYFLSTKNYEWLRSQETIGWTFILFGIFLYLTDKIGLTIKKFSHVAFADAIIVGVFQAIALIPGTSRSGITISAARLLGFEREEAAKFSMIISIPTIIAAGSLVGYEIYKANDMLLNWQALGVIFVSFITALFSISFLMWWVRKSSYTPFVIYRLIFGALLLADFYGYINL